MGWGERFLSHNFVPLYWNSVIAQLVRWFPSLQERR
jgi:hypothetical protein